MLISQEERVRRFSAFRGKFADIAGSSDDFAREKRAEIKREEAKNDLRAGRVHGNRNGKERTGR